MVVTQEKLQEWAVQKDNIRSLIATFYLARYEARASECFPDANNAFLFAFTELAEVVDANLRLNSTWNRNNHKELDVIGELYDTVLMSCVTAIASIPEANQTELLKNLDGIFHSKRCWEPDPTENLLNYRTLYNLGDIKIYLDRLEEALEVERSGEAARKRSILILNDKHLTGTIKLLEYSITAFIKDLFHQIDYCIECGMDKGIVSKNSYYQEFWQHLNNKLTAKHKKSLSETLEVLINA
jgi:hypothetical protein